MSKGFNMIGWRLGWVCGHPKIVQAYADVKDNSDSGQFMAIQQAAAVALRTASIPKEICAKYRRRLSKLVAALQKVGFPCRMPGGTYFLYAKAPVAAAGREFKAAEDVSQFLIHEQSISCVPWDDAGPTCGFRPRTAGSSGGGCTDGGDGQSQANWGSDSMRGQRWRPVWSSASTSNGKSVATVAQFSVHGPQPSAGSTGQRHNASWSWARNRADHASW